MKIQVIAAGCVPLLENTSYHHGQCLEGGLSDALRVVGELHEHGLDVMLSHLRVPLLEVLEDGTTVEHTGAVRVYVVHVNWLEQA